MSAVVAQHAPAATPTTLVGVGQLPELRADVLRRPLTSAEVAGLIGQANACRRR